MRVDLNADVGESFGRFQLGQDPEVLPLITSANIACGFHAGDPHVMRRTVKMVLAYGVALGAHPGFPDLGGFGRRNMALSPAEVEDVVVYQIGALAGMAAAEGAGLKHVKPHGALYNLAADDRAIAEAIARAVRTVDASLTLVGLAGSQLITAGRDAGLRTASEVFADRGYGADGRLLARGQTGALIDDLTQVGQRAARMVSNKAVQALDGTRIACEVDTICVHGDSPHAAAVARAVREALTAAGITIAALAPA